MTLAIEAKGRTDRDAAIVRALRRGEPDAAERLVRAYRARALRLAARITGNRADAEEVAQDALWAAARKIHTFRGGSLFGSWLYRIVLNAAYQKVRSDRARRHEVGWEAAAPVDRAADLEPGDEALSQVERRVEVRRALMALPASHRDALVMHAIDGHTIPDVARSLGITPPAAKSRVHRSVQALRRLLGDGRAPEVTARSRTP